MDIIMILVAFGAGCFASGMGALTSFALCGVMCIPAAIVSAAGIFPTALGSITFGPILGPYVAWAGASAAAAYAGKRKLLTSGGADICTALNQFGDAKVILVGGLFGALAQVLLSIYTMLGIAPLTDGGALVVVTSHLIARFMFGTTGLTGKYTGEEPRRYLPNAKELAYDITLGGGIGIMTSAAVLMLANAGATEAEIAVFPFIMFGFSATIFLVTFAGVAIPATHHLTYPSASAAILGYTLFGPAGVILGVVFGVAASIFGDITGRTINSYVDSHIDPPACTITLAFFLMSAIRIIFA